MSIDYKAAGVDVEAGNQAVHRIKQAVESTFSPQVLSSLGGFAALYDLKPLFAQYHHPLLVQSIDGVGTKMMVASKMQKFDTIGIDLVSATANDIIVIGAKPLTLLDYIANDRLKPEVIEQLISGMVKACRDNDIALVGGETAEMPGTYVVGEHDLVGVITGVVDKEKAITGQSINAGDIVAMLPSSGLHTNGYSLARKLLFEVGGYTVNTQLADFTHSLGEELLIPHINYTKPILSLLKEEIYPSGMAHITGGGLLDNIPRILPANCRVLIDTKRLPILPLFDLLQHLGRLNTHQMHRTFNMGAGLVLVLSPEAFSSAQAHLKTHYSHLPLTAIGEVVCGETGVELL